jgi:carbon monoxide dehydrogenase subunit G
MATIRKDVSVAADATAVWDAVRDFAAPHVRLAPQFLKTVEVEGRDRIVAFANGLVARESLVAIDDPARRLVYAIVGGRPTHYNGSIQVSPDGPGRCRVRWTVDLLPDDMAAGVDAMMDHGVADMKRTLERPAASSNAAG